MPNYSIQHVRLTDLVNMVDLEHHAKQQCGVFKLSALERCHNHIQHQFTHPTLAIAYEKDSELFIEFQNDLLNHFLAIYKPEEMGIDVDRTKISVVERIGFTTDAKTLCDPESLNTLISESAKNGSTELEQDDIRDLATLYRTYSLPIMVYDTREEAKSLLPVI